MNALHYAAYFDVPELIRVLLKAAKPRGLPDTPPTTVVSKKSVIDREKRASLLLFFHVSHSAELHMQ